MPGQIPTTIDDPPDDDRARTGLVDDQPGPDREGARGAVEVAPNATNPRHIGKQAERFVYATKNGLRAIDAAIDRDLFEQRVQIAFSVARKNDSGSRHSKSRSPQPAP